MNKLLRYTEVRIFLKFRENSGSFFFKKKTNNLLSPCDYKHGVTGKARAMLWGPEAYAVWGDSKQTNIMTQGLRADYH